MLDDDKQYRLLKLVTILKPRFLAKNIFSCEKLYSTRNAVLKKLQRQIQ